MQTKPGTGTKYKVIIRQHIPRSGGIEDKTLYCHCTQDYLNILDILAHIYRTPIRYTDTRTDEGNISERIWHFEDKDRITITSLFVEHYKEDK